MSKNNRNNLGTKNKVSRCLFFCLKKLVEPDITVTYFSNTMQNVTPMT